MVVFPLFYLAPIEYYALLIKEEKIVLETQENYQKQTYRNRCCIYSPNGKQNLTIPILHKKEGRQKATEIEIDNSQNWQKIHWKSIEAAYRSSPFFEFYENKFEPLYSSPQDNLFNFNRKLLELTIELLSIEIIIEETTKYYPESFYKKDYRESISPKKDLSANRHEATLSIPFYHQVFNNKYNFISNLSIIDLLFNEGPNSKSYLLNCTV